jgi:anti-sigma regulatory factor (Ser/Thr protein kinase)
MISVRYSAVKGIYWWIISDQGGGFEPPSLCEPVYQDSAEMSECGRGLMILHQIFDEVRWQNHGTELRLGKQMHGCSRSPLIH